MKDESGVRGGLEGVRERKRRETRQRIADAGLRLFAAHGYEATTVDAIAVAAGISRRTFFHYFKSKDDILLSLQGGLGERLVDALAERPATEPPLAAARAALMTVAAPYSRDEMIVIDRLMRSSEAVQARKQAAYIRDEEVLFAALRQRWQSQSAIALRLVASLTIAAARLSIDAWRAEGEKRTIGDLLTEAFDAMASIGAPWPVRDS